MGLKVLEIISPKAEIEAIERVTNSDEVVDWWRSSPFDDERFSTSMMVKPDNVQTVLDALQQILDHCQDARVMIHSVDATLPKIEEEEEPDPQTEEEPGKSNGLTREELFEQVETGSELNQTYLLLTALSAIVAAIGMVENSVAAVIGAMVIAPLLGPNLALALGSTLGETALTRKASIANLVGLGLAIGVAFLISFLIDPTSNAQLDARTVVSYGALILALASGAAAVLSLLAGVATGLVGVMVAVALMPPAVALGLFLGWGQWTQAGQALLLLFINITAINLSAKLILVFRGVTPRRWPDKSRAKKSSRWAFTFWGLSIGIIIVLIYFAQHGLKDLAAIFEWLR
ncbi:MAG: TIGR00341 family protein [Halothiobacillus sp.]|nr:TIGR00341 family protein [Halothiobacillus sp.]